MTRAIVAFLLLFGFAARASPSGAVAILFDGKLIDTKPSRIVGASVLVPLVRGGEVLMPFRALIDGQAPLGEKPRVTYDAAAGTVDIAKPPARGAVAGSFDMRLTVGTKYVTIDGRRYRLDVAPEIYQGSFIVPLRAVVGALHAYAAWVVTKHLVVVGLLGHRSRGETRSATHRRRRAARLP